MNNSLVANLENRIKSVRTSLDGFPWVIAGALYTFSWGWSLLRPNTIYWDDWAFIYGQPKSYLNQIFVETGLPPWRALIDQELISIGYWTIPVLTFLLFFLAGVFIFGIFQKIQTVTVEQNQLITVLFLIIPINHSRIALVLFGYTTSYFLFFAAWFLLVRCKKFQIFLLALLLFFWSFMTHSFLFFYLLPIIHFLSLQNFNIKSLFYSKVTFIKTTLLILLPFVYYFTRMLFWYPKSEWYGYQRFELGGAIDGARLLVVGALIIGLVICVLRLFDSEKSSLVLLLTGWIVFAWGLFPYFVSGRFRSYVEIVAFRSDWSGRHIMLTPLGAALILAGLANSIFINQKKLFRNIIFSLFVAVNVFFGSQFYLDSLKKIELTQIFIEANSLKQIYPENKIIFTDETKIFNGRFSTYRDPELQAKLKIADVSAQSITGNGRCSAVKDEIEIKLKTNKSYIAALFSRDLGLYFEISEC